MHDFRARLADFRAPSSVHPLSTGAIDRKFTARRTPDGAQGGGLAGWSDMDHPTGLAVSEHLAPNGATAVPMVVLVHGSLDRSTSFTRVLRRLGDLHTVAYDRRGYHRSRHAGSIRTTLDGHVDDLLAVIDRRPAVVVGHSYGGTIALAAALRTDRPSTITSLAAYEPPLPWLGLWSNRSGTESTPSAVARDRAVVGDSGTDSNSETDSDSDSGAAAERFFRRVVGTEAWERLSEPGRAERRADGPALVAELNAIRLTEAPFDVSTLQIPSLFGRGERSLPHHRAGVAWLVEHTPGAQLADIPGARHGAHLSHPDGFASFVRRAVERSLEPAARGILDPL